MGPAGCKVNVKADRYIRNLVSHVYFILVVALSSQPACNYVLPQGMPPHANLLKHLMSKKKGKYWRPKCQDYRQSSRVYFFIRLGQNSASICICTAFGYEFLRLV